MVLSAKVLLLLALAGLSLAQQRSLSAGSRRRNRLPAGKAPVLDFSCPEDFGYYSHPEDCTLYYVCVFGGALMESCTGGLVYSNELQTCDWPRNVHCNAASAGPVSTVRVTDPRTAEPSTQRRPVQQQVLTPSVSSAGFSSSRGKDDVFSGPSSNSVNRQGRTSQVKDNQQDIRGRFQIQESSNRDFSVSPTTSRSFSFPPALPSPFGNSPNKPSPTRVVQNEAPNNVPTFSRPSEQSRPAAAAPTLDDQFYSDLLNLTDAEYFFLYEDLLLDDYYDDTVGSPAPTATQRPTPIRNLEPVSPVRGTKTASSSLRSSLSLQSLTSEPIFNSRLPQTPTRTNTRTSQSRGGSSPNSLRSSSRSSTTSRQQTQPKSSPVSTDRSKPSRLSLKPVSEIVKKTNHLITNIWQFPPRRPAPIYPQPTAHVKAGKCDRKVCRLPDCSCGGKEVPGGIAPQNVPQMVLLTFDDSVNDLNKELYKELFERGRTNPNGCPIAATFYISHEWTDYSQVQNLYADGHEIASHSITHSFGEQFSKLKWAREIAGQREIMAAYGGVRMEDIRGMRAPFLSVGGNKMFEMLYEQNFTYDSSMPVYENRPPSYPYTLDYKLFHDCMIPPCPTHSFPGLWEVPMVMWQDLNGGRCSMGDACTTPPDAEGVYKMLIKNFERHYTTNRAPMGLFYHAAWFTTAHHKEGFIAFLDTISNMQDVWLVTNWQALQWTRNPVPISQANTFKPFQCSYPERPPRCNTHKVCNVWHKGGVRYMRTCQRCPEAYPWVGRTGVQSPLNE